MTFATGRANDVAARVKLQHGSGTLAAYPTSLVLLAFIIQRIHLSAFNLLHSIHRKLSLTYRFVYSVQSAQLSHAVPCLVGIEVAIEEDEAASVEIAEAEEEADGAITEGEEAAVVFEVIEAEVEVVVVVEEEGMEGRLVVANKPSRSFRKIEPHVAKL